jgi:hypothetical protein
MSLRHPLGWLVAVFGQVLDAQEPDAVPEVADLVGCRVVAVLCAAIAGEHPGVEDDMVVRDQC